MILLCSKHYTFRGKCSHLLSLCSLYFTDLAKLPLPVSTQSLLRAWVGTKCFASASYPSRNHKNGTLISKNAFATSLRSCWWLGNQPADNQKFPPTGQLPETSDDIASFVELNLDSDQSTPKSEDTRRIHILGAGSIGRFVAHAIAGASDRPPITLIFRSGRMLQKWKQCGQSIQVVTDGYGESRHKFETEILSDQVPRPIPISIGLDHLDAPLSTEGRPGSTVHSQFPFGSDIIRQLIISIKAPFVVRALSQVAHRLSQDSSILFFPDGMGLLEEVNKKVFPDERTRPTYINGLNNHTLESSASDAFAVVHAAMGTMALGISPRHSMLQPWKAGERISLFSPSARYLLRTLTRIPALAAVGFAPTDMFQLQLERLAIRAVVGPLSVVFDCVNGELLHNTNISRVKRLLIAEISLVARSLPELRGVPNVTMRFSPERLEALVVNFCIDTTETISPMLKNVRAASSTEIDFLSGYIIRRGEEMGIKCLMNYLVVQCVKGKVILQTNRFSGMMPIK